MSFPPSILHIVRSLHGHDDAVQTRLLAEEQVADGARVGLIAFAAGRPARARLAEAGIWCRYVHHRWPVDPFAAKQVADVLLDERPDAVHLWGWRAVAYASVARLVTPRARILATLPRPQRQANWLLQQNLRVIDRVAVESRQAVRDWSVVEGNEQNLAVVPPAVEPIAESGIARDELMAELELPSDARLITCAGPLVRGQQVDEAIWSFELVRTLLPQACLLIVGTGADRGRLERFARHVSEPAAIRFLGERIALSTLLAHSELYWDTSPGDALAGALLMALAAGIPVVANPGSAQSSLLAHEENALLSAPASRAATARYLTRLLEDPQLSSQLAAAGRHVIDEHFSSGSMRRAYEQLYQPAGSSLPQAM